ncbi:MAG: flavin reductase [Porticoccaceae bacterium]|nr:flavin reductase [Porticoccaceae bacterium]MEA3298685.1 flavin reductase [Pseudomonadota bacterium]HLS99312.1 flavin reductase [Porticoccaceae bacterium]
MRLSRDQIDQLDKHYRTHFINAITGFKSANLVGTVSASGHTNLAVISSVVHVGAHPPLNAMVFRPHSVPRDTLENILATGHYSLNHIHGGMVAKAHQTSARYPREQSEFAATGLGEAWIGDFPAPFVAEARIRIGMGYREHHHLAINDTVLVIGEVLLVEVPDDCVAATGHLDLDRAGTLAINGLDGYHETRQLARLAYAKPDREPRAL